MAASIVKLNVVGFEGRTLATAQVKSLSTEYMTVTDETKGVAGANATVYVPNGNAGGGYQDYQVTQTQDQVNSLANADTVAVLDVVGNLTVQGNIDYSTTATATAFAGGGQGSATQLTLDNTNVTTVATAGDSVKLPTAVVGYRFTVKNNGANSLAVFPATSGTINGGSANASITLQVNESVEFLGTTTTNWETTTEVLSGSTIYADTITEKTAGAGVIFAKPIIRKAGTAKAVDTTGAITAAELAGGYVTSTSAGTVTATLPTATLLATQLGAAAGTSFEFIVDNSAGANVVTVAVNTGITVGTTALTGGDSLTVSVAQAIAVFRLTFTSTTAAILRRIC